MNDARLTQHDSRFPFDVFLILIFRKILLMRRVISYRLLFLLLSSLSVHHQSNGQSSVQRSYSAVGFQDCYSTVLIQVNSGDFLLGGDAYDFGLTNYNIVEKTNSIGQLEWSIVFGDTLNSEIQAICVTSDGNAVVAGNTGNWSQNLQ